MVREDLNPFRSGKSLQPGSAGALHSGCGHRSWWPGGHTFERCSSEQNSTASWALPRAPSAARMPVSKSLLKGGCRSSRVRRTTSIAPRGQFVGMSYSDAFAAPRIVSFLNSLRPGDGAEYFYAEYFSASSEAVPVGTHRTLRTSINRIPLFARSAHKSCTFKGAGK